MLLKWPTGCFSETLDVTGRPRWTWASPAFHHLRPGHTLLLSFPASLDLPVAQAQPSTTCQAGRVLRRSSGKGGRRSGCPSCPRDSWRGKGLKGDSLGDKWPPGEDGAATSHVVWAACQVCSPSRLCPRQVPAVCVLRRSPEGAPVQVFVPENGEIISQV